MKGFLHTIAAIASLLLMSANAQAQERAGATETEYGNIVVYLETAEWGQKSPYNKFCFTSNGSQAVTGCVPTAYAILMHYHKWPDCANEKKVYHSGTGESIMLGHNYEWDNMLPQLSPPLCATSDIPIKWHTGQEVPIQEPVERAPGN